MTCCHPPYLSHSVAVIDEVHDHDGVLLSQLLQQASLIAKLKPPLSNTCEAKQSTPDCCVTVEPMQACS